MNIGTLQIQGGNSLPYLAIAYALFFLVIFAYVISLTRRQARAQEEITLLRRAVDEELQRR